jgi:hypothetical protein
LLLGELGAEWLEQQGRCFVRDNPMTDDDTKLPAADEPPQKKFKKGN